MVLLQIAAIYTPIMQEFFGTVALTPGEFVICMLLGSVVFWAVELEKLIIRRTRLERRVEQL
jgi:Ca2+-transporting ATPase